MKVTFCLVVVVLEVKKSLVSMVGSYLKIQIILPADQGIAESALTSEFTVIICFLILSYLYPVGISTSFAIPQITIGKIYGYCLISSLFPTLGQSWHFQGLFGSLVRFWVEVRNNAESIQSLLFLSLAKLYDIYNIGLWP